MDKGKFLDYLKECRDSREYNLNDDEWSRFVWFVRNFDERI